MPSPMLIMGILLALSVAGNAILSKLYVGAKQDVARVTQAYDSFKAQVKVEGDKAATVAKAKEMSDKLAKDTADAENKATVAALNTAITKLRSDSDRARGSLVPPAPAGSKRPDLACFDRAALESADGIFLAEVRGIADKGTTATVNLATASKWATSLGVPPH